LICVYIPTLLLALIVVARHGAHRQLGWVYLAIRYSDSSVLSVLAFVSPVLITPLMLLIWESVGLGQVGNCRYLPQRARLGGLAYAVSLGEQVSEWFSFSRQE
jgi:hypothetical protein